MSPRFVHLGILLSLACIPAARAADAAAASKVPAYQLKNKSAFIAPADDQRAPFWPIGWVKRKAVQTVAVTATRVVEAPKASNLDPKDFKVTSILIGSPSLAIINGRTYSEGEFLRLPRTSASAPAPRVRVYRIGDGTVLLQNQEQFLTAALQRPQLAQRSGEESLLVEDRP